MRFLIIGLILFIAYLVIRKKLNFFGLTSDVSKDLRTGFQLIEASPAVIQANLKKTISNVVMGVILVLIVVLLFIKIKIVLFLLPIAIFLLGYLFLFNNHFNKVKSQQIWYNAKTDEVFIEQLKGENYSFNLFKDIEAVQKIESIQTTRGLLYGYYRIKLKNNILEIPYLVAENKPVNNLFFDTITKNFKIDVQKRIFPII